MNVQEAFNVLNLDGQEFSKEEIKTAYRQAMKKFHPDRASNEKESLVFTEISKAVNAAYDFLSSLGDTVKANINGSESSFYDYAEELREVLNKLFDMVGLDIEVCGNWIWISGNTKPYKDELGKNGLGCFWASQKKRWYYRPEEHKSRSKGATKTMEEIRAKYGSNHYGAKSGFSMIEGRA